MSSQSLDLSPTRGVQVPSWVQHLSSRGGSCSLYLNAPIFYAAAAKSLQSLHLLMSPRGRYRDGLTGGCRMSLEEVPSSTWAISNMG